MDSKSIRIIRVNKAFSWLTVSLSSVETIIALLLCQHCWIYCRRKWGEAYSLQVWRYLSVGWEIQHTMPHALLSPSWLLLVTVVGQISVTLSFTWSSSNFNLQVISAVLNMVAYRVIGRELAWYAWYAKHNSRYPILLSTHHLWFDSPSRNR